MTNLERARRGPRRWWPMWAAAAFLLASCGGGSSGGDSAQADTAVVPINSTYWAAAITAHQGQHALTVWDPADAQATVRSLPTSSYYNLTAPAWAFDPVQRTRTAIGISMAFLIQDGHAMKVDLRRGQSHDAVQISNLNGVCGLSPFHALNAEGTLGWIEVSSRDGQGACNQTAYIRTDMSATSPAKALPGVRLLMPLIDDSGAAQTLLAAGPASSGGGEWLQAYDGELNSLGLVTAADTGTDSTQPATVLALDPTQAGAAYVAVGGEVRRLRWSGQQVSLDNGSMRHLATPPYVGDRPGSRALAYGERKLYLVDGDQLLDLHDGTADVLTQLNTDEQVWQLLSTPSRLVWNSFWALTDLVSSVPKTGGSRLFLSAAPGPQTVYLEGVHGEWVVLSNGNATGVRFQRMHADGSEVTDLAGLGAGPVFSTRSGIGATPDLHSMLLVRCTGQGSCGPTSIVQIDVDSLGELALGQVDFALDWCWAYNTYAGVPGLASATNWDSSEVDALMFQPGQAVSLSRVTRNLPGSQP